MKEYIETIPVNEAFQSGDECPFCWLEREVEQKAIRYCVGHSASYMEPDVRGVTDVKGFCTHHAKSVFDYGNVLGCALILQTHYAHLLKKFQAEAEELEIPAKKGLFSKKKTDDKTAYWQELQQQAQSCFICDKVNYNMARYYETFFALLKEPEFRQRVEESKGFCLRHFGQLLEAAEKHLPNSQREWFYKAVFKVMEDNLVRVKEDLDWFVGMFDYRQAGADWKNSRDAVPRAMQKLQGLHPADPVFKKEP